MPETSPDRKARVKCWPRYHVAPEIGASEPGAKHLNLTVWPTHSFTLPEASSPALRPLLLTQPFVPSLILILFFTSPHRLGAVKPAQQSYTGRSSFHTVRRKLGPSDLLPSRRWPSDAAPTATSPLSMASHHQQPASPGGMHLHHGPQAGHPQPNGQVPMQAHHKITPAHLASLNESVWLMIGMRLTD